MADLAVAQCKKQMKLCDQAKLESSLIIPASTHRVCPELPLFIIKQNTLLQQL